MAEAGFAHQVHDVGRDDPLPDGAGDDGDTCRICRGEGSPEEPLFYPCKCSGSIKFVHQDCLMEWLSHSQKKYCELCKTPFRFTKLYHPGMPARIPTSVFLRRAALHVFRFLTQACRTLLVATVWLAVLPSFVRVFWRTLFCLADGTWTREFFTPKNTRPPRAMDVQGIVRDGIARAGNNSNITIDLSSVSQVAMGEPLIWFLMKGFLFGYTTPQPNGSGLNTTYTAPPATARSPSLLSNVSFFRWFSSDTANNIVIEIFEGIIISLGVVIAFILIFLIREWVVQQQPVINMAAMHQDAAHVPAARPAEHHREPQAPVAAPGPVQNQGGDAELRAEAEPAAEEEVVWPIHFSDGEMDEEPHSSLPDDISDDLRRAYESGSAQEVSAAFARDPEQRDRVLEHIRQQREDRAEARPAQAEPRPQRRRRRGRSTNESDTDSLAAQAPESRNSSRERSDSSPKPEASSRPGRRHAGSPNLQPIPDIPARDKLSAATEIRRDIEEDTNWSFANVPTNPGSAPQSSSDKIPETWDEEAMGDTSAQTADGGETSDQGYRSAGSHGSWQQVADPWNHGAEHQSLEENQDDTGYEADGLAEESSDDTESEDGRQDQIHSMQPTSTATTDPDDRPQTPDSSTAFSASGLDNQETASDANPDHQVPPDARQPTHPPVAQPPRPIMDRIADWIFGDVAPAPPVAEEGGDDERVVQDLADEGPFVPFADNEPQEPANPLQQDPEVAAAAAQAGINLNDQDDAIDDAEDLEGIMELIGLQGPLVGLFQNAMFSAVLISGAIGIAVWLPYLFGKVALLVAGSPISICVKLPLKAIAVLTDLAVDLVLITALGLATTLVGMFCVSVKVMTLGYCSKPMDQLLRLVGGRSTATMRGSIQRIGVLFDFTRPQSDSLPLQLSSHAALRSIQNTTSHTLNRTGDAMLMAYDNVLKTSQNAPLWHLFQLPSKLAYLCLSMSTKLGNLMVRLWNSKSYKVTLNLDFGYNLPATYVETEEWTATDRSIAILAGYACLAIFGALYLRHGSFISSSRQGRRIEAIMTEILQQAGGVLKVILIISIEMLVFPLYCGLLLDLALLPLFADATVYTRWQYACDHPWTSGFVHWFIGTCYMFHFALFVSMCRRILRKGVLYFIRDPDDPTFHPVRDVLERSVTTQLRKIAFSAVVYGALVIICLGGVVWCLARCTTGVLPIQWSSHAPSVEFPMNLLVYNFLTPFIIKLYKPSDALQDIYHWWFMACAGALRLSNFLFGEKVKEEEGHHVRQSWYSWFKGERGDVEHPVVDEEEKRTAEQAGQVYFVFDGKYVRAPASDQTRIPKGETVFVEVDEEDRRKDGKTVGGVHNTDACTKVYIPPWFRVRIALFVAAIWLFAAATGVSVTILPLLFGRYLFSMILPSTVEKNDIHALSLGLYSLGALGYVIYRVYDFVSSMDGPVPSPLTTIINLAVRGLQFGLRIARIMYVWTALVALIPLLFALVVELYLIIPLHAYVGPDRPHVIPLIQDWTLGFLYARVAASMVLMGTSRAARAFTAVTRDGYLDPNARIATRCFVLPVLVLFSLAVGVPASFAWTLTHTIWANVSDATKLLVWRFTFPLVGLAVLAVWLGKEGVTMLSRWRTMVRDEVYLIGERLHNFGEKRTAPRRLETRQHSL